MSVSSSVGRFVHLPLSLAPFPSPSRIAKEPTAEARILQCFRWFILGFYEHFHPLSDIAKKPFNSILGETYTTEFIIGMIVVVVAVAVAVAVVVVVVGLSLSIL